MKSWRKCMVEEDVNLLGGNFVVLLLLRATGSKDLTMSSGGGGTMVEGDGSRSCISMLSWVSVDAWRRPRSCRIGLTGRCFVSRLGQRPWPTSRRAMLVYLGDCLNRKLSKGREVYRKNYPVVLHSRYLTRDIFGKAPPRSCALLYALRLPVVPVKLKLYATCIEPSLWASLWSCLVPAICLFSPDCRLNHCRFPHYLSVFTVSLLTVLASSITSAAV